MHFLNFKFPKLRGLNSHLVRPDYHTIDRTTLLDIVSHNHQSSQEIASISQVGQGSFLSGLGTLFGITIQSIAKGGGTLINDLVHGLQHTFEGLGTFTHAVTTGIRNSTGTILHSAGHALHDTATETGSFFLCIIGGISGSLLSCVLFVIILYLINLKLANNCLSPFNKPHSFHTPSVTETPIVSEDTTSISHPPAIIDNPPAF